METPFSRLDYVYHRWLNFKFLGKSGCGGIFRTYKKLRSLIGAILKQLLFGLTNGPTNQSSLFQRALSLLTCFSRKLLKLSPISSYSKSSPLNCGVPYEWAPENMMHIVSIVSPIKSFKRSLTVLSHTYTVSKYVSYTITYLHSLETITPNLHLTYVVWDCTTYFVLPSF